jgi:hypothetical protein
LVYHGGAAADGVYTLQMIDVRTAWSERRALYGRSERAVGEVLADIIARCPLPIREVHSDNGTEFLNYHLQTLLGKRLQGCRISRSRPWQKNDNRFVEQKNYTLVRAYLPRNVCLLTPRQAQELNALYEDMGLYYNLFEPVLRQTLCYVTYTPDGHVRVRRQYDRARTPLSRLLETDTLAAGQVHVLTPRSSRGLCGHRSAVTPGTYSPSARRPGSATCAALSVAPYHSVTFLFEWKRLLETLKRARCAPVQSAILCPPRYPYKEVGPPRLLWSDPLQR